MNATATVPSAHGELVEPTTLRLVRLLPGPIDRVWAYLTESDMRAQWLAAGQMEQKPGARVKFVWRNDDLSGGAGERPEGMSAENTMECEVIRAEPPRLLELTWGASGSEVMFELEPVGDEVRLTLTHRRLPSRDTMLGVSAGWHAHLDVLLARLGVRSPEPFWPNWKRLRADYDARIPS